MAEIIDQIVKISIQDAISSVTTVDVNTVALVGLATTSTPVAGEIASVADAVTAYGENSELTAMVKVFFAQDSQPSRVVCIPAGNTGAATLAAVQAAAQNFNFYHVVMATWDESVTATLLTGSFVIETLFSVPGIGSEFVSSVSNRDYPLIMALTLFYGAFIIIANIVTDLITAGMDPRIRLK
jgi:ABC-type microcin C transport system permease subunit YejB